MRYKVQTNQYGISLKLIEGLEKNTNDERLLDVDDLSSLFKADKKTVRGWIKRFKLSPIEETPSIWANNRMTAYYNLGQFRDKVNHLEQMEQNKESKPVELTDYQKSKDFQRTVEMLRKKWGYYFPELIFGEKFMEEVEKYA